MCRKKRINKFKETVSVNDERSSGRPRMSEDKVESIRRYINENPRMSIRTTAHRFNLSKISMHKSLKERKKTRK